MRQAGFTLIEILIAVALVGILAGLAVMKFSKQARKARGAEVQAIFAELRNREEQYHLENGVYFSTGANENAVYPANPGAQSKAFTPPVSTSSKRKTSTLSTENRASHWARVNEPPRRRTAQPYTSMFEVGLRPAQELTKINDRDRGRCRSTQETPSRILQPRLPFNPQQPVILRKFKTLGLHPTVVWSFKLMLRRLLKKILPGRLTSISLLIKTKLKVWVV